MYKKERGAVMRSGKHSSRILFTLFAAVCIAVGTAAGWYLNRRSYEKQHGIQELSVTTVKEILTPAADLITTKYHYTDSEM